MKKLFLIICLFLLIAMGPSSPVNTSSGTISPMDSDTIINSKAPDFTLKDMNGKNVTLSSFRGKVVLLNFWATWCPPCKAEMPDLNRLYRDTKRRGLEIIAISTDKSIDHVKDFLSKNKLDFIILFDENRAAAKQYKVFSMPTTFLIDRNGMVVEKFYGEYEWTEPEVKGKIEKLL
jgi:peroxiredoxin